MGNIQVVSPLIKYMSDENYIWPYFLDPGWNRKSVYLPFTATGVNQKEYYFNSDDELNGNRSRIRAIELVDSTTLTTVMQVPAKDTPAASVFAGGFLYIKNSHEIIAEIPLYSLIKRLNSGKLFLTDFSTQIWQTCSVTFNTGSAITSANSLQFIVHFDPNDSPDVKRVLVASN